MTDLLQQIIDRHWVAAAVTKHSVLIHRVIGRLSFHKKLDTVSRPDGPTATAPGCPARGIVESVQRGSGIGRDAHQNTSRATDSGANRPRGRIGITAAGR